MPAGEARHSYQKPDSESGAFTIQVLGAFLALMILAFPFWDTYLMLYDPVLSIFVPKGLAQAILMGCLFLLIVYIVTTQLFRSLAHQSAHGQTAFITMLWVFLSLYGAFLCLASFPLASLAHEVQTEAVMACGEGPHTRKLAVSYSQLVAWREDPTCSGMESVEQCRNLTDGNLTAGLRWESLKAIENNLRCSGFCISNPANASSTEQISYPRPLFSNNSFQGSCNGAAGRQIKFMVGDFSRQMFWQGAAMVAGCLMVGFLTLFVDMKLGHDYLMGNLHPKLGSSQAARYGAVP